MTIKQKPLSRRKSFKYFTPSIPDNVDDFWEVAKDGEIDNEIKDDTLEFPESSAINDSSLKFKKEFIIAEAPQDDFIILSEKNESVSEELGDQSLLNELTNKKSANQNLISEGNQNLINKLNDEGLSNKPNKEELSNKPNNEGLSNNNEDLSKKGNKLTNQNDIINYDIASNNFTFTSEKEKMKKQSLKKNKKPILKDNTNLSKKKSFLPVKKPNSQINSTIQNSSPNKLNLVRRSSIIKSKSNEILAIIDSKRFNTNLNSHTKLKKINKTEVALVNLSINSKIKDQSCNRNMIITIIKGSIKVDYNDNSFILKAGGICFVEKETVYSIIGNSSNGSVFQIVYVR